MQNLARPTEPHPANNQRQPNTLQPGRLSQRLDHSITHTDSSTASALLRTPVFLIQTFLAPSQGVANDILTHLPHPCATVEASNALPPSRFLALRFQLPQEIHRLRTLHSAHRPPQPTAPFSHATSTSSQQPSYAAFHHGSHHNRIARCLRLVPHTLPGHHANLSPDPPPVLPSQHSELTSASPFTSCLHTLCNRWNDCHSFKTGRSSAARRRRRHDTDDSPTFFQHAAKLLIDNFHSRYSIDSTSDFEATTEAFTVCEDCAEDFADSDLPQHSDPNTPLLPLLHGVCAFAHPVCFSLASIFLGIKKHCLTRGYSCTSRGACLPAQ